MALDNGGDMVKDVGNLFDFALGESLFTYNEQNQLSPMIAAGKPVYWRGCKLRNGKPVVCNHPLPLPTYVGRAEIGAA
jgi:hypothetical protein